MHQYTSYNYFSWKEQGPSWESNSLWGSLEIPRILWNANVHGCVHNSLPLVSILSQVKLLHILSSYFFKIYYDIILPSMPRFSK